MELFLNWATMEKKGQKKNQKELKKKFQGHFLIFIYR